VADTKGQASDEDLNVLQFSSDAKARPGVEQRVPLFFIDDKAYTVPRFPNPAVGLRYLKILHEESEGEAVYYLLQNMLGEEGYDALMEYSEANKLSPEQFEAVVAKALRIATRQDEGPKGIRANGRNSRRR
jgi:hypothetical protein